MNQKLPTAIFKFTTKQLLLTGLLVLISCGLRFWNLASIPPVGPGGIAIRLPTVVISIVTILLLHILIYKKTGSFSLGFLSGLALSLSPWYLEQSRIYSQPLLGLGALLLAYTFWQIAPCRKCKVVLILTTLIVFWRVYPDFWLFHPLFHFPTLREYFGNLFKLISGEFLFYANDSFWLGGLRTGAYLPSVLVLLVVGIGTAVVTWSANYFKYLLLFLLLWLLSAASPQFPESREYFLTTPIWAFLIGLGSIQLINFFKDHGLIIKIILVGFLGLLIYEHLIFWHTYITHYPERIRSEIPYEKINF